MTKKTPIEKAVAEIIAAMPRKLEGFAWDQTDAIGRRFGLMESLEILRKHGLTTWTPDAIIIDEVDWP